MKRVREATSEIKEVARRDPVLGAEGAVRFLEKVSPALEQVDSSSGSIGNAVNKAIEALVPIIAEAPLDRKGRAAHSRRKKGRMIERSFIHVGGQPGAGKTTLIDHLLRSFDGFVSVARCHRHDTLEDFEETRPAGNPELRRYREAGAEDAICYRFPERHARDDSFFLTEMMEDYSNAVILEGEKPLPHVDVSVYVAEPPDDHGSLLVRRTRDRAREQRERLDAMEQLLSGPGGVAKLLEERMGKGWGALLSQYGGEQLEDLRDRMLAALQKERRAPPPEPTEHWGLARGYEGIQWAQVVIVNVRNEDQRDQAEAMVADLRRLRKDQEVFQDILAPLGNRVPITAVAADLSDPRDPGTRKGLTRILRSMRGG